MILHIARASTFISPFIKLVSEHFPPSQHYFLVYGEMEKWGVEKDVNVELHQSAKSLFGMYLAGFAFYMRFLFLASRSEKIIFHSLFNPLLLVPLAFLPRIMRKCHWVVWGWDLYEYIFRTKTICSNFYELFRRIVIKRFSSILTYIKGDYELAKKWYHAKGVYSECIMYPSNFFKEIYESNRSETILEPINILVGNSASKANGHIEMLEKLLIHKSSNIRIFVPLSYGDINNAREVIEFGKKFENKFFPILKFMTSAEYTVFLSSIDIAIFNHKTQAAMGNIISLLGLGKKVYMRNEITSWECLQKLGVKMYSLNSKISLTGLNPIDKENNIRIIKAYFSKEKLIEQLHLIFGRNCSFTMKTR